MPPILPSLLGDVLLGLALTVLCAALVGLVWGLLARDEARARRAEEHHVSHAVRLAHIERVLEDIKETVDRMGLLGAGGGAIPPPACPPPYPQWPPPMDGTGGNPVPEGMRVWCGEGVPPG